MSSPAKPEQYTDAELDIFCVECPWLALEHNAHRLTPEQIEVCYSHSDWAVIVYAPDRLTSEQIKSCSDDNAWLVLECATRWLTPDHLEHLLQMDPVTTLQLAAHKLTRQQLLLAVAKFNTEVCYLLNDEPTPSLIYALYHKVLDQLNPQMSAAVHQAIARAI